MRKTKIVCTIGPATTDEGITLKCACGKNVAMIEFFTRMLLRTSRAALSIDKKVRKKLNLPICNPIRYKGGLSIESRRFRRGR